jgi:hypothetical protein
LLDDVDGDEAGRARDEDEGVAVWSDGRHVESTRSGEGEMQERRWNNDSLAQLVNAFIRKAKSVSMLLSSDGSNSSVVLNAQRERILHAHPYIKIDEQLIVQ